MSVKWDTAKVPNTAAVRMVRSAVRKGHTARERTIGWVRWLPHNILRA
eukprot:gene1107-170_t